MTHLLLFLLACGGTPDATPHAPDGRTIDVVIDGTGYTPDTVDAKAGEPLTLVFERLDANNCGGEVVFPSTGEKHTIPVGEKVAVHVKAPGDGNLAFTCGMGMYEGAIVVSGG